MAIKCALVRNCVRKCMRRFLAHPLTGSRNRSTAMKLIASAVLAVAACLPLHAQIYPVRAVHMVIGFPAGGPVDFVGRLIGTKLGDVLGQQVVIENRVGANAIIGTEFVAKSIPDGYTMVLVSPG